jgi:hypothetical protein
MLKGEVTPAPFLLFACVVGVVLARLVADVPPTLVEAEVEDPEWLETDEAPGAALLAALLATLLVEAMEPFRGCVKPDCIAA